MTPQGARYTSNTYPATNQVVVLGFNTFHHSGGILQGCDIQRPGWSIPPYTVPHTPFDVSLVCPAFPFSSSSSSFSLVSWISHRFLRFSPCLLSLLRKSLVFFSCFSSSSARAIRFDGDRGACSRFPCWFQYRGMRSCSFRCNGCDPSGLVHGQDPSKFA